MPETNVRNACAVCGRTACNCCQWCGGSWLDECHELCDPDNYACVCPNEWCDEHNPDGFDF